MKEEAVSKLDALLHGEVPVKIDLGGIEDPSDSELADKLNELFDFMRDIHEFIVPLSRGELFDLKLRADNYLASPFKELHSRLLHLTWQTERVAAGDYGQRVDFMGDFSEAFNSMIVRLAENESLLKRKIGDLEEALARIDRLEGMLPICSNCKKIRVDGGDPASQESWVEIESYISRKTAARFTHGLCPECFDELYPELKRK